LGSPAFLALAARGDDRVPEHARIAGFSGLVEKPFEPEKLVAHVMAAVSSTADPAVVGETFWAEENGCPVFRYRAHLAARFMRFLPSIETKLRALVEEGHHALVVDLGELSALTRNDVGHLTAFLAKAKGLGLRVGICAPIPGVAQMIRSIAEMRSIPCAES